MAAANGGAEPPVIERLHAEPHKYNFYQLVRLLEMSRPASTSVGAGADPKHEPVRFRSSFSLAFPASDIGDLQTAEPGPDALLGEEGPPEVTVNFLLSGS